jgi:hypothetical protein
MLGGVNYLGHVAVALAGGRDEPHFLLGAALPDLASMAGVRLDRDRATGPVADGVACHLAADTAFHDHPAFRAGAAALRRDLGAAGLATGPRRAIGHAGWELLLDGTLTGTHVEVAYREALAQGGAATAAVVPGDRPRWAALLAHGAPPPLRYDDPAWVAERLAAMLGRRPRLAMAADQVPVVAEVLDRHLEPVRAVASQVVADVAASVAASSAGRAGAG